MDQAGLGAGEAAAHDRDPVLIGTEIPPFVRVTDLGSWNRYAAVNDEFVPIHMDDAAGRAAGQPGAFGMGQLQVSYLHSCLRDWVGPDGAVLAFSCRFRSLNLRGDTVTARGRVTAVSGDGAVVDLDVWTENQDGVALATGTATVRRGG